MPRENSTPAGRSAIHLTATEPQRPRRALRLSLFATLLVALAGLPAEANSGTLGLEGSWNGGGWVSFSSGARERARCRAKFAAQSDRRYFVTATCATESGKVSQTASIRQAGANAYVGTFYNNEYDVSGTIRITVHGNTQTARLSSGSGSAVITLGR